MRTEATPTPSPRRLAFAAALVGLLLGGCAGGSATAPGEPGSGEQPLPDAAREFQHKCEQGLSDWREGRVTYPKQLTIPLGESVNYEAAVDIRDNPLPADQVIDAEGGSTGTAQIFVRCRLAARLTPLSDSLEVSVDSEAEGNGWITQEFTPSGVVEWSWSVTANEPTDATLRLDLRPSLQVNELPSYSSANQVSFTTDITVEASFLQRTWFWIQTQWPLVLGVVTPIGAAILALLGWARKVRGEVSPVTRYPAAPPQPSSPAASTPHFPGPQSVPPLWMAPPGASPAAQPPSPATPPWQPPGSPSAYEPPGGPGGGRGPGGGGDGRGPGGGGDGRAGGGDATKNSPHP